MDQIKYKAKPIFVLASGRAGTQFLSKVIDISPDIVMRHEAYASLLISTYSHCPKLSECNKSQCIISGSKKDDQMLKGISRVILSDIKEHYSCNLRLGESSSHLPFLVKQLLKKLPISILVLSYRDPIESLASVVARKKWNNWFGEFDGRCRYALGVLDGETRKKLSFEDRWLLSWCDVWQQILDACNSVPINNVIFFELNSFSLESAERLLNKCDLKYDKTLLSDRYPYFSRHSSYKSNPEVSRNEVMKIVEKKVCKSVKSKIKEMKQKIKESGIPETCDLNKLTHK